MLKKLMLQREQLLPPVKTELEPLCYSTLLRRASVLQHSRAVLLPAVLLGTYSMQMLWLPVPSLRISTSELALSGFCLNPKLLLLKLEMASTGSMPKMFLSSRQANF